MSAGEYGFFLGVTPGVSYTLWNLMRVQKALKMAQGIARDYGEVLDIDASPLIRFNYIFRPQRFTCPQDGDGVRRAKAMLLSLRRPSLRRHVFGAMLVVLGGFVGVAIELGVTS